MREHDNDMTTPLRINLKFKRAHNPRQIAWTLVVHEASMRFASAAHQRISLARDDKFPWEVNAIAKQTALRRVWFVRPAVAYRCTACGWVVDTASILSLAEFFRAGYQVGQ